MSAIIKRLKMDIADQRAFEQLQAENERLMANIDYVAMMADIDIPTEEEVSENV